MMRKPSVCFFCGGKRVWVAICSNCYAEAFRKAFISGVMAYFVGTKTEKAFMRKMAKTGALRRWPAAKSLRLVERE